MIGFLAGLTKIRGDMLLQFLVLVVGYFIVASVVGSGLDVSARFRVPMMPFVAILSSYGWMTLRKIK